MEIWKLIVHQDWNYFCSYFRYFGQYDIF